jgi:hypothetical protein
MNIQKFSKTKLYIIISFLASIFWIMGFIMSLYNYSLIQNINIIQEWNNNQQQNVNMNWDSQIGEVNQYNWQIIPKTQEEIKVDSLSYKAKSSVKDFYNYINNKNFDKLYNIFDKPFKEDSNIKTYFSNNRINRFLWLIDWTIKPQEIEEDLDERKDTDFVIRRWFRYFLKYEIKNQPYKEIRKMILVSNNWGENFYINSLFCETKDCWKLPFYN